MGEDERTWDEDAPDRAMERELARREAEERASVPGPLAKGSAMARYQRHPAEVTSDRLADALDRWPDKFSGAERDEVSHVRFILEQIAEGER